MARTNHVPGVSYIKISSTSYLIKNAKKIFGKNSVFSSGKNPVDCRFQIDILKIILQKYFKVKKWGKVPHI